MNVFHYGQRAVALFDERAEIDAAIRTADRVVRGADATRALYTAPSRVLPDVPSLFVGAATRYARGSLVTMYEGRYVAAASRAARTSYHCVEAFAQPDCVLVGLASSDVDDGGGASLINDLSVDVARSREHGSAIVRRASHAEPNIDFAALVTCAEYDALCDGSVEKLHRAPIAAVALGDIGPNEELSVGYGDGYWLHALFGGSSTS